MRPAAALMIVVALTVTTAALALDSTSKRAQKPCPVANAAGAAKGKALTQAVTLEASAPSATQVVNLGADREPDSLLFRVSTPEALPDELESRLELVADPITRTSSETAETVTFGDPTFSQLRVSGNRKHISFRVCLDPPDDLPAGKYTGLITLEGPPGVEPATVTVIANAKDGLGFVVAAIITMLLTAGVLLYKAAAAEQATRVAAHADQPDVLADGAPNTEKQDAASWRKAAGACVTNPGWVVPTLAAIFSVFGVLWAAYASNPAWGDAGFLTSAIALIGAGLAAVGAKSILTSSGN